MGEARRRGTKEQRIAQAIARRKLEDAARSAQFKQREAERIARLTAQERREAVMIASGGSRHLDRALLASMLGASAPLIVVDRVPAIKDRLEGDNQQ